MKKLYIILIFAIFNHGCTSMNAKTTNTDNYLWLEQVEGKKALEWVKEQNKITNKALATGSKYDDLYNTSLNLLEDKDKIPHISIRGDYVYNFWQSKKHIKGLWRRATLKSYQSLKPNWSILIDFDKLAKDEHENWVFKQSDCLAPNYDRCLIYLSRGGKDASVMREFDIKNKKFVTSGFKLPEAKSWVSWRDKDSLYVGTNFGPNSMTTSGYPKITKVWHRGTLLSSAKQIFEASPTDMGVHGGYFEDDKNKIHYISQYENFYSTKKWLVQGDSLHLMPIPKSAQINSLFKRHLIISLKKELSVKNSKYPQGSVLAIKQNSLSKKQLDPADITLIMKPSKGLSIERVSKTKNYLVFSVLNNIKGEIHYVNFISNKFTAPKNINYSSNENLSLGVTSNESNLLTFYTDGFLNPRSLKLYDLSNHKQSNLKSLKKKFNSDGMIVEQRWSISKDGTKIPYFIVGKKDVISAGNAPTEMYGYGGFNLSLEPSYNPTLGKLWLEKGGVYVLANIRGGGEFGPVWHQSAILKNKHKSYEDFIAIAENLIKTGVTNSNKLSIRGGSNGGLLVGAVMAKRPDLFKAVVCLVPLLDMMRYHKLLAGASWVAEYGNPDKKEMRDYILTYSPYQNIDKSTNYPSVFFMTSTKDDRVHPGHARKMAIKMMELGHPNITYYENTEGGHAASSNLKQRAKKQALIYNFLSEKLMN